MRLAAVFARQRSRFLRYVPLFFLKASPGRYSSSGTLNAGSKQIEIFRVVEIVDWKQKAEHVKDALVEY